jgi:endonuclease/exonuclease/phosphatase family metal-dependent hydrolase
MNRTPATLLVLLLAAETARADTWERTAVLPAPEATQAAAADGDAVYAVSSTGVAKYERSSGRLLGRSEGDAKHLNSAFLFDGKLYLAHSNYPQTPERSEIKGLDPATMRLTTFKDFGDVGGSLTWAVRRDGSWWCCFAKYGAENRGTRLVRFDDAWKELGRWSFPEAVFRDLGAYSLSGGIWRGDELLATGHDLGVLYRLRLPREGTALELVGAQPVPFTGQGFAEDPATGGLVGIHRAGRQLVFAALRPGRRIRVLSYNIHHGEGVDGVLDLPRIAGVIRAADPDVAALQEVDRKTTRTKQVDQAAELGRLTGMTVAFGGNIELQGGSYGNALLSRWPTDPAANHKLPRFDEGEQRGVLAVPLRPPGWPEPLLFLATHFDHRRDDRERLASAARVNELAPADGLAILAGDLNAGPASPVLAALRASWAGDSKEHPTTPVGAPARQIDFVLCRPAARWRIASMRVLDEAVASDHRAILAVLEPN